MIPSASRADSVSISLEAPVRDPLADLLDVEPAELPGKDRIATRIGRSLGICERQNYRKPTVGFVG